MGSASASATGNTITKRGVAYASVNGSAQGQQISISTYTATNVSRSSRYTISQAVAEANVSAQDQDSYATASYFGSSIFTNSLGSSKSRNLALSTTSYNR